MVKKVFKRTVRNSGQNSKYTSKWRPPVADNAHPENQTKFSKVPIIPGDKSYRDAIMKKSRAGKYIDF